MAIYGSRGYIAWLFGIIYMWVREVCRKSFYVKLFVHSIGLIVMVWGLFLFITELPSFLSAFGVFIILIGLVVFFISLNLDIK